MYVLTSLESSDDVGGSAESRKVPRTGIPPKALVLALLP